MALTPHQREIEDKSLEILMDENRLLIKGSAGVGKTFLADSLIKSLINRYDPSGYVYCCTPTHKALSVLKGKVTPHYKVQMLTIHSALKLKRVIHKGNGSISFKPNQNERYPALQECEILLIDEASMLSTEILTIIESYAMRFSVKVIFLGDEKQLNPVGEDNSPVFHAGYPEVELTEIIRQGEGNPIIELSRNIPSLMYASDTLTSDHKGYVFSSHREKAINSLAAVNGTDEIKYLAWTNAEVNEMNSAVRERIYTNPKKIEVGETLVFDAPYGEKYYTNYELLVDEVRIVQFKRNVYLGYVLGADKYQQVEFTCYVINPDTEHPVKVIHEDSEADFAAFIKLMKSYAIRRSLKWIDYYIFLETFADLKYNHAITVHKSQGSTYKKTIVNVKNINFNKNDVERKRLMYTAITRASDLLILYGM